MYKAVYDTVCPFTAEHLLDASNLCELLRDREQNKGLHCRTIATDESGCLIQCVLHAGGSDGDLRSGRRHQHRCDTKVRRFALPF